MKYKYDENHNELKTRSSDLGGMGEQKVAWTSLSSREPGLILSSGYCLFALDSFGLLELPSRKCI